MSPEEAVTLEYRGRVAIITLNQEKKLNALNQDLYYRLACCMHEIAARDDISVTVLTAKGRFFSAGADVSISRSTPQGEDARRHWLKSFVANNLHITHAFYTHPKILVTALNGPAVGLSAALIAFSDFIYAAPHAFLLTPFSSLGLVTEGGASRAFVQRLGISKANEALIMSKKITAEELVATGFVNKIVDVGDAKASDKFLAEVLKEVDDRLGEHLNQESLLKIKALIRRPEREVLDAQGVHEVIGGLERFLKGVPQEEFRKIAAGEKKHKL
ncbi:enoyl-CoA hydratase [Coniosporium apollinis CBS 100218]|uniref:Enoyl-CoA hydratase n=1 Tax=Coniosporium apollinis (strain CBS 100218) TaxID=1168221 RepID=R7YID0_CONA1|nr:enoyl-CoA hydratase [Coniosporium apollinis CBS 100218]EON61559.1 enoyl-CoA hydratase [Coniosporium apollinis CBS 100218]